MINIQVKIILNNMIKNLNNFVDFTESYDFIYQLSLKYYISNRLIIAYNHINRQINDYNF